MPLFFFHHEAPGMRDRDDVGCEFATFELAYLDAFRSMVEMGAELLLQQCNPASHKMTIAAENGEILADLRFDEVFCHRGGVLINKSQRHAMQANLERGRKLAAELRAARAESRASLATVRETLRRAQMNAF